MQLYIVGEIDKDDGFVNCNTFNWIINNNNNNNNYDWFNFNYVFKILR